MSVDSSGAQGNGWSLWHSLSADGRCVAFTSDANNLVPGDSNNHWDVFVRDRHSGTTSRVSVNSSGGEGNSGGDFASISADGRCVAFRSIANNLVSGDTNATWDIFVHDRETGVTSLASVSSSGVQANYYSRDPAISADGRHVTFGSLADNLVSGDTLLYEDIFVHDRQTGLTTRVSVDSSGVQGDDDSFSPSISADGGYVAFDSDAEQLVAGDTNGSPDVFVHDRSTGTTIRVSVDSSGAQGNDGSYAPWISADGRYVAFTSLAANLVPGDTNGDFDVFVHDRQSGQTSRVSVDSSGTQGNDTSYVGSISADGRYVAFNSRASNLVPADTNGEHDVFVHDRESGSTTRISVDSFGAQGNDESRDPRISADGCHVAFYSYANNLVSGDTNGVTDIFVHGYVSVGTKYCTSNANSTGAPADLSACGSTSSAEADLGFEAVPVPNQFGIFFHGASQTQVVFGNGFLCTADDIARGAVIQAAGNLATYSYDNSDPKHDLSGYVGSTRNFQYWFRDPAGGGALFNTSNAISIAILP